jgi:hypothetical protein
MVFSFHQSQVEEPGKINEIIIIFLSAQHCPGFLVGLVHKVLTEKILCPQAFVVVKAMIPFVHQVLTTTTGVLRGNRLIICLIAV